MHDTTWSRPLLCIRAKDPLHWWGDHLDPHVSNNPPFQVRLFSEFFCFREAKMSIFGGP